MNDCNDPTKKSGVRPLLIMLLIQGFNRAFRYSDFRKELKSLIAWDDLKHCVSFIYLSQQQPNLVARRVDAIIPILALPAHTDPPHQQQLTYMPLMLPQPRIKFLHLAACAGMIGIIAKQAMALIQIFSVQTIRSFLIVLSGVAGIVIDELIWV